ncbi:MAG: CotH kinase family protein, partial [Muribaculaceae bacterium]|nr:CotH kinase family protein [Muribaculaceae bacterium]
VRAKVFCKGYLSPRSTTHSYIWHAMDMTIPVVSMVTNGDYFYDEKVGIYVKGSYNPDQFNYQYDWRRPINLEFFDSADTPSRINQLCETRVKGNTTRVYVLKSLAVYANKRFGEKRFNYEFFPDQTPDIEEFKSFEMRNSGNDFDRIYMRDAIIQKSMGMNCDIDWQPSRPAVLYINGEYKGILNIRPRSNEDHVYSYYDGLEDIDMIENLYEVKSGTKDNFDAFKAFYKKDGHTIEEFDSLMDTGEFCNLMVMNIFFNNKDFPGNNNIMWRPQAEGGRWRWIAKDTDHGLGLFVTECDFPTLTWITTPGYDSSSQNNERATRLFIKLLAIPEFKAMFIDRGAIYMGDFLSAKAITNRIDAYDDAWHLEFLYFRKKISPWSYDYVTELERTKEWEEVECHISTGISLSSSIWKNLWSLTFPGKRKTVVLQSMVFRSSQKSLMANTFPVAS